jgi:Phage integrase, N-terminal SAM-like domain
MDLSEFTATFECRLTTIGRQIVATKCDTNAAECHAPSPHRTVELSNRYGKSRKHINCEPSDPAAATNRCHSRALDHRVATRVVILPADLSCERRHRVAYPSVRDHDRGLLKCLAAMPPSALLQNLRDVVRRKHYSIRTEETYVNCVKDFIRFHRLRHPSTMDESHVIAFLTHLAVDRSVSASTQNQALNALVFLYKHVLNDRSAASPAPPARNATSACRLCSRETRSSHCSIASTARSG